MRISFQRLRWSDMVGWLIKGCTIVPLRKSANHFEDFCVFCNLISRCALAFAQGCPLPSHESSQLSTINGLCIGKLGGSSGSFAGRSLVRDTTNVLALLVTNYCHAVLKLPAVVSDQLFCHQSRHMLPSHKRCNFGNSSSS